MKIKRTKCEDQEEELYDHKEGSYKDHIEEKT